LEISIGSKYETSNRQRAAIDLDPDRVSAAMQPIHYNSDTVMNYVMGQDAQDQRQILIARKQLAEDISNEISHYLCKKYFDSMDTVNGYKKGDKL
jgi:hypothetical protein